MRKPGEQLSWRAGRNRLSKRWPPAQGVSGRRGSASGRRCNERPVLDWTQGKQLFGELPGYCAFVVKKHKYHKKRQFPCQESFHVKNAFTWKKENTLFGNVMCFSKKSVWCQPHTRNAFLLNRTVCVTRMNIRYSSFHGTLQIFNLDMHLED